MQPILGHACCSQHLFERILDAVCGVCIQAFHRSPLNAVQQIRHDSLCLWQTETTLFVACCLRLLAALHTIGCSPSAVTVLQEEWNWFLGGQQHTIAAALRMHAMIRTWECDDELASSLFLLLIRPLVINNAVVRILLTRGSQSALTPGLCTMFQL